jgi:hypothetical protein
VNLYCRLALVQRCFCVGKVGGYDPAAPAGGEPTVKYHPEIALALTGP